MRACIREPGCLVGRGMTTETPGRLSGLPRNLLPDALPFNSGSLRPVCFAPLQAGAARAIGPAQGRLLTAMAPSLRCPTMAAPLTPALALQRRPSFPAGVPRAAHRLARASVRAAPRPRRARGARGGPGRRQPPHWLPRGGPGT